MQKKAVRILALVVAAALLLMMLASVIISSAYSEPASNRYELDIVMLEDSQALQVTQRFFYINNTGDSLDRLMFCVYGNVFRRYSTVFYEDESALPWGYVPGGIEFSKVTVNGEDAKWAMDGTGEYYMRVECALETGESCVVGFEYTVLMTQNRAFLGVSELDWRLSGFYPMLCMYLNGDWQANEPCAHSRYALTDAADYEVKLTVPGKYVVAATGEETLESGEWSISATGIREFSASVGRAWRLNESGEGVAVNVYSNSRSGAPHAAEYAARIIEVYEAWFGEFPSAEIDIVQSDCALAFSGAIWIKSELFESGNKAELWRTIAVGLAEQYFGLGAYADPLADSWMCAAVCEYVSYLAYEEIYGYDAFAARLNERLLPALQVTLPGDYYVTINAGALTGARYDIAVRERGCAVMHEMRCAMGRENLIASLARYYADCRGKELCVETDLTAAMLAATGYDWTDTLTYWLFNIDQYSEQTIDYYE